MKSSLATLQLLVALNQTISATICKALKNLDLDQKPMFTPVTYIDLVVTSICIGLVCVSRLLLLVQSCEGCFNIKQFQQQGDIIMIGICKWHSFLIDKTHSCGIFHRSLTLTEKHYTCCETNSTNGVSCWVSEQLPLCCTCRSWVCVQNSLKIDFWYNSGCDLIYTTKLKD